MASAGKGASNGGFLSRLRSAFRERFIVGASYDSYVPPAPSSTAEGHTEVAYRYPAPASQPPAVIPTAYPETVYDTAHYKRSSISLTPPPGADPEQFLRFAQPGRYGGNYPRHTPKPWWYYDEGALKARREMYVNSGGLVGAGWSRHSRRRRRRSECQEGMTEVETGLVRGE